MALTQLLPIEMLLSMLNEYKWVILFYAVLIGVIYRFRDKFDWQNKFIGLYRTKFGLQLMERLGKASAYCQNARLHRYCCWLYRHDFHRGDAFQRILRSSLCS
jgi:hypothetical protein